MIHNNYNLFFDKTTKNKSIILKKDKLECFYFEGIRIKNRNYVVENTILLTFGKRIIELKLENIIYLYYEGLKKRKEFNNDLIIESIEKSLIFNSQSYKKDENKLLEIIKIENCSLSFVNKNKKIFNNNSIEKLYNISYEKCFKTNKLNNYEINQNIVFSFISDKKGNNNKKFKNLEISKDIKNILFFKAIIKNTEKEKEAEKEDNSLYEDIYETPKKGISTKLINNISNTSNISNIKSISTISNQKTEKKENSNSKNTNNNSDISKVFKKVERASRAINRIRKKTQTQKTQKPINNDSINEDILSAFQNFENKNTNEGFKYRQSFKIMSIAKELDRQILKPEPEEKKEEENKKEEEIKKEENMDNNTKYRDSNAIDIISLKPIDNKKKKKNRISFMG